MRIESPFLEMLRRRSIKRAVLSLFQGLLLPGMDVAVGVAIVSEKSVPISAMSDQMTVERQKGLLVFQGNVVIVHGNVRLEADLVEVFTSRGGAQGEGGGLSRSFLFPRSVPFQREAGRLIGLRPEAT